MTRRKSAQPSEPPALIALRRAAKDALKLALQTGTGCHVEIDGKIVDIAKKKRTAAKKRPVRRKKKSP